MSLTLCLCVFAVCFAMFFVIDVMTKTLDNLSDRAVNQIQCLKKWTHFYGQKFLGQAAKCINYFLMNGYLYLFICACEIFSCLK